VGIDFEALVQEIDGDVARRGGAIAVVAPEHARQVVRDTVVTTHRWVLPERGEVRSVSIEGRKVHILTAFVWPEPGLVAPVYAMEFVVFGPRPIVAVIDAVGLAGNRSEILATEVMRAARAGLEYEAGDDPPAWYVDCRSGEDIFARPASLDAMPAFEQAHGRGIRRALDILEEAAPCNASAAHAAAQTSYKHHHAKNSPGRPWLQKSFGEDWTERYLLETVFG
jgi:hypothetical protein